MVVAHLAGGRIGQLHLHSTREACEGLLTHWTQDSHGPFEMVSYDRHVPTNRRPVGLFATGAVCPQKLPMPLVPRSILGEQPLILDGAA